ncbi:MAG: carbohydrate ABC transporter permease [Coriobacteriales bacterium]|jgi:hypothetical ABC-type maltose transport systems,permease component
MIRSKEQKKRLTKSERDAKREKIKAFIILFIASVFFAFPFIYMLGASFKSDLDLQLHPENIFPSPGEWTLKHYGGFIWRDGKIDNFPFWILNSLWSTLVTVGLTVILDLITAYAVVFLKFKGKNAFVKFLMLWMAVPGVIGTTPSFAIYASIKSSLNLTGAAAYAYIYFWMIVPCVTGIFNLLLMKNFFDSIPKDIVESAKSDGASNMKIFRRIIVPLAKSTIMLIVLFTFVNSWNQLIFPQLILAGEDSSWQTITLGLLTYTGGSSWGRIGVSMASSVFALIPTVIVFIFTQNKMIDGLASTGIKM